MWKPSTCPQLRVHVDSAQAGGHPPVWSGLPFRVSGPQRPRSRQAPGAQPSHLVGLLPGPPGSTGSTPDFWGPRFSCPHPQPCPQPSSGHVI